MKKRARKSLPKKKRGLKRLTHVTLFASAILVGVIFTQNGLNQTKNTPPHIDSISPSTGRAGSLVVIKGSGFTTQADYDKTVRIKNSDMPVGNYLRIAGDGTMGQPVASPDGKTLKFQLALASGQIPDECQSGATGPKCQIQVQVVNGEGIPSNIVKFQVYTPVNPLVTTVSLDPKNPPPQNIKPGATDVEVLRFNVKADASNPVNVDITDFTVKTVPTYILDWGVYCKDFISDIKLVDASTGELLGSHPSFSDNLVNCQTTISTWLSFVPGEEKTFSLKISAPPQAKAGIQFNVATYPGTAWETPGGNVVTSNLITIAP